MDPCANGGTCTNSQGSYDCACDSGWDGDDCNTGKKKQYKIQWKCIKVII